VLESLKGADDRPWASGELEPTSMTSPDAHDAAVVLAKFWSEVIPIDEDNTEPMAPFGREFPGLAPTSRSPTTEAALKLVTATMGGRLGLVAVTRPADAIALIGWLGPVNCEGDMGLFSTVLRSWEDRFGAFVVGVGFDTLTLAVQRPPRDYQAALRIAAEHYAMCSDNINQVVGDFKTYAEQLVGQITWKFWWD
jgi:hypothetical protein